MKILLKFILLSIVLVVNACAPASHQGANEHFEGYDIEVRIDGVPTIHTEKLDRYKGGPRPKYNLEGGSPIQEWQAVF